MNNVFRKDRLIAMTLILSMLGVFAFWSPSPVFGETTDDSTPDRLCIYFGEPQYTSGRKVSLEIMVGQTYREGDSVSFVGTITSSDEYENCLVRLEIQDEKKEKSLFEGQIPVNLKESDQTIRFDWKAEGLTPGKYVAQLKITRLGSQELAACSLPIYALSKSQIGNVIAEAESQLGLLQNHLNRISENSGSPAYAAAQSALAADTLAAAQKAFNAENLAEADVLSRLAIRLCGKFRADLTFSGFTSSKYLPGEPLTIETQIEPRNGNFMIMENPIYLLGFSRIDDAEICTLSKYGLNVAVGDVPTSAPGKARGFLDVCAKCNVRGVLNLYADQPGIVPVEPFSHIEDVAASLSAYGKNALAHPILVGISLAKMPRAQFMGEDFKRGFMEYVASLYGEIGEVNAVWRSRLFRFDEIVLAHKGLDLPNLPNYTRHTAYQYDLQTYNSLMMEKHLKKLRETSAKLLPDIPFLVTSEDDVFSPGESAWGLDRELLARDFDILGCATSTQKQNGELRVSYPRPAVYYALMQSLAPEKTVMDIEMRFWVNPAPLAESRYEQVYTAIWNAFVAGADGLAIQLMSLRDGKPLSPLKGAFFDCVDAVATAALDVNRLAPYIAVLQSAEPEVVILWSLPARLSEDEQSYLRTLQNAYEGASYFGLPVGFVTERQCIEGVLTKARVLIVPDATNVFDETFAAVQNFVESGGCIIRMGRTMTHDQHGRGRRSVLDTNRNTLLIRGDGLPRHYLGALDEVSNRAAFPAIPRTVNEFGYPLEGVVNRAVRFKDDSYLLYVVNLRHEPVYVCLAGKSAAAGKDLISGRQIDFPVQIPPCEPMLIQFDASAYPPPAVQQASEMSEAKIPAATLEATPRKPTSDVRRGARSSIGR